MWLVKSTEHLHHQKNLFLLRMYKMNTFAIFTAEAWKKWCWSSRIWWWNMDRSKIPWKKLDIANITDKILLELKKMRCKMQECGKYQPCRIFIKSTLVIKIKMSSVKTQAAIFRDKSGVNQHNKVLRKQQSLDLRLKKLFPNEEIIEEYSALHYRTDFTF